MKEMALIRTRFLTLLLVGILLSPAMQKASAHEFYISLSELRYNTESGRFELSMRIFPDDMDRALELLHGHNTMLVTELEIPAADSLLRSYLLEVFRLINNGTEVSFTYLGKEAEADAMWCYLESEEAAPPREIEINSALLTGVFPDQVNVVQVYVEKWNRGLLLTREQQTGQLKVTAH